MDWLDAATVAAAVLAFVIAAKAGGLWASAGPRRKKSRARGPFLAGLACGLVLGAALTARHRGLIALAATLKHRRLSRGWMNWSGSSKREVKRRAA
jgi:hypothetical protein